MKASSGSESVACAKCGSVYRGAALRKLDRSDTYERAARGIVVSARCICTSRDAKGELSLLVTDDPTVFIVRSRESYSLARLLMRAVRKTDATVFARPLSWASGNDYPFSIKRASNAEFRTTPEELESAIRGLLAGQKAASSKRPFGGTP